MTYASRRIVNGEYVNVSSVTGIYTFNYISRNNNMSFCYKLPHSHTCGSFCTHQKLSLAPDHQHVQIANLHNCSCYARLYSSIFSVLMRVAFL